MIAYLDSSALVKKYVGEPGSQRVISLWGQSEEITCSAVGYAEVMAALHRRRREGTLSRPRLHSLIRLVRDDWASLSRIEVSDALNGLIERLVASHGLRGVDAIHLASALSLRGEAADVLFVCADRRLAAAARAEGLTVEPAIAP
jgi:predicted nucleic acid-binding protein